MDQHLQRLQTRATPLCKTKLHSSEYRGTLIVIRHLILLTALKPSQQNSGASTRAEWIPGLRAFDRTSVPHHEADIFVGR